MFAFSHDFLVQFIGMTFLLLKCLENGVRYLHNGLVLFHQNKCTSYFVSSSFGLATKIFYLKIWNKQNKRIKSFDQESQISCSQKKHVPRGAITNAFHRIGWSHLKNRCSSPTDNQSTKLTFEDVKRSKRFWGSNQKVLWLLTWLGN